MVLYVLLLSFFIASGGANLKNQTENNTICVERGDVLKLLHGHDGLPGLPGLQGDRGLKGSAGLSGMKGLIGRSGFPGSRGRPGPKGEKGCHGSPGEWGMDGDYGIEGWPGEMGYPGRKGEKGDPGLIVGPKGIKGMKGVPGKPGHPQIDDDIEIYALNNYYVAENGRHNNFYNVKSRDLTDGRTDTGGWGSATARIGNYIEATYIRPVYVTSVTVAGGFIPSWRQDLKSGAGHLDLEYSLNATSWVKVLSFPTPVEKWMISYDFPRPIVAKYWRLRSSEDKWVGTTEFALKPLIEPK